MSNAWGTEVLSVQRKSRWHFNSHSELQYNIQYAKMSLLLENLHLSFFSLPHSFLTVCLIYRCVDSFLSCKRNHAQTENNHYATHLCSAKSTFTATSRQRPDSLFEESMQHFSWKCLNIVTEPHEGCAICKVMICSSNLAVMLLKMSPGFHWGLPKGQMEGKSIWV